MKQVHALTLKAGKIVSSVVSGTNFPFEYILYPVLKDAVIGQLPIYSGEQYPKTLTRQPGPSGIVG